MAIVEQEYDQVTVEDLIPHPENPNNGNLEAIKESITSNGFYGALVVQLSTHHILIGNHRFAAAKELGFSLVPVIWIDVDDEEALRIMLADNQTASLAVMNKTKVEQLLESLNQRPKALAGTGFKDVSFRARESADKIAKGIDVTPIVSFTLMFDDETQKENWYAFQHKLRERYGESGSQAERIDAFLRETILATE